jgi:hypothetical protein
VSGRSQPAIAKGIHHEAKKQATTTIDESLRMSIAAAACAENVQAVSVDGWMGR